MSDTATTSQTCKLDLGDQTLELPVVVGSENERGIDITALRNKSGYITLDSGFGNTGSCQSEVTFIDGEKGILRYRGIPIEQIAEHGTFIETCWLLTYGELPTREQLNDFSAKLTENEMIHEGLKYHFEGFPPNAHPMAVLSAMIQAMGCFHPDLLNIATDEQLDMAAARLISKVRTIAAYSYKQSVGQPSIYPHPEFSYCVNFLHMMFSEPYREYQAPREAVDALRLFLILHADHEQNCSTSTVRMVASSGANLFASISAAVSALWGPLHGGANVACIRMLEQIRTQGLKIEDYIAKVKDQKNQIRLMGFGHRVYKNFDPRARILKQSCDRLLTRLGVSDDILDIAKELEDAALHDEYFLSRNLYPNVDFYSGIILRTIGIPLNMFTVMFAIGRMPGWIAHWREEFRNPKGRIYRPRQIYTGYTERPYVAVEDRG